MATHYFVPRPWPAACPKCDSDPIAFPPRVSVDWERQELHVRCGVCGYSPGMLPPDQIILQPHEQAEGTNALKEAMRQCRASTRQALVLTPRTHFKSGGRHLYVVGPHPTLPDLFLVSDTDGGAAIGTATEIEIRTGLVFTGAASFGQTADEGYP